jgi:molecular chaperone DnaK
MENTINIGIDLGTTNSVIAKCVRGEVHIFNNPLDYGRSTLPSVVAFRKDSVLVGSKAKEYLEKRSKDVVGTFKRKMGTSEMYPIATLQQSKSPIDLSAHVLKELKTFLPPNEPTDAVVITIPASFDTIQSNATQAAGEMAGFKQVVLLQEPIAASLAFVNRAKANKIQDGQWLVYDLGGGTFDVALIKIQQQEMKVLDHEGDNFLGGADFDQLIVEKFIIPRLETCGNFRALETDMKSAAGKYNSQYYICLHKAEQAKIALSAHLSAEIEIQMEDDDGNEVDERFIITRSEFEALIQNSVDNTLKMVRQMVTRNGLTPSDIQFVLMVGGSTYIPFVRRRVEEVLQIPANFDIDPTTAVAIGAAFYAGTKLKTQQSATEATPQHHLKVKTAFQTTSQDSEEFFAARIDGPVEGYFYKITRNDGGYSTGVKPLAKNIQELLPLIENEYNYFTFHVFDAENNRVETNSSTIGIAQGKYGIVGQPLPNDICLEVDDIETSSTKLECIFPKNATLPLKVTKTKTLNKSISKGSHDSIRINVLEGPQYALPAANFSIGYLEIKGTQLTRDISKGSEIEISFSISENRKIAVTAYINMSDQEFKEIFSPEQRHLPIKLLKEQMDDLSAKLNHEIDAAKRIEDYETAQELYNTRKQVDIISAQTEYLSADDVTDKRYQLEHEKRKIAQEIDNITRDKRMNEARAHYQTAKTKCEKLLAEHGNDGEFQTVRRIIEQESVFLSSSNAQKVNEYTEQLERVIFQILWRMPEYLCEVFAHLEHRATQFNDASKGQRLLVEGRNSITNKNWGQLAQINRELIDLLPQTQRENVTTVVGF